MATGCNDRPSLALYARSKIVRETVAATGEYCGAATVVRLEAVRVITSTQAPPGQIRRASNLRFPLPTPRELRVRRSAAGVPLGAKPIELLEAKPHMSALFHFVRD